MASPRLSARLLLAGLVLTLAPCAFAADEVKSASTSQSEDELGAAKARLDAAATRVRNARVMDADARTRRASLLGRAHDLRVEAATSMRKGNARADLVSSMDALTEELTEMADASVSAAEAEPGVGLGASAPESLTSDIPEPHAATTVLRFHDVAGDVMTVFPRLSDTERDDARQLVQSGEDLIAMVKDLRRADHEAHSAHLRSLDEITAKLQALYQTGLMDRGKGQPFVPAWRTPDGYLLADSAHDDLHALRVAFVKPGTAWVTLENTSDQRREWFVEIQFYDRFGEATGAATRRSRPLEELNPHEVRKVEVQLVPTHPRFWDVTAGWSIYLE